MMTDNNITSCNNMIVGENAVIKDSGNRRQFETGAVRDMPDGKGRMDLIHERQHRNLRIFDLVEIGKQRHRSAADNHSDNRAA